MNDNNIDNFKRIDKNKILNDINREMSNVKEEIEYEFKSTKNMIDEKINKCLDKTSFDSMTSDNYYTLNQLINRITMKSNHFDNFLKGKNKDIIDQLNLQELQKDKENFEANMRKLEELKFSNSVSSSSSSFIENKQESYTEGYLWWKTTKYKDVYDHDKTKAKYQQQINKFFEEGKQKSIQGIEANKNKIYYNIEGIFKKFNEEVTGFKNHINEFEKTVKDVENFIYQETGIK